VNIDIGNEHFLIIARWSYPLIAPTINQENRNTRKEVLEKLRLEHLNNEGKDVLENFRIFFICPGRN
jgi:hypothetical protein